MDTIQEKTNSDNIKSIVIPSILAGFSIGVAALCNLKGGQYIGAALFAFGLGSIVCSNWNLFTGMVGFINNRSDLWNTTQSLLWNIIGVVLACFISTGMGETVIESATTITNVRLAMSPIQIILMAIGCGFIMTLSVKHARNGQWIPLLFGIPTFIMCGFPHCIADITYYCISGYELHDFGLPWIYSVIGNTIGCNIPTIERMFQKRIKELD